jgi:hypothetical protein
MTYADPDVSEAVKAEVLALVREHPNLDPWEIEDRVGHDDTSLAMRALALSGQIMHTSAGGVVVCE